MDEAEEVLWYGTQNSYYFEEVLLLAVYNIAKISCLAFDAVNTCLAFGTHAGRVQSWRITAKNGEKWHGDIVFNVTLEDPGTIAFDDHGRECAIFVYGSQSPGRVNMSSDLGGWSDQRTETLFSGYLAQNRKDGLFVLGDMSAGLLMCLANTTGSGPRRPLIDSHALLLPCYSLLSLMHVKSIRFRPNFPPRRARIRVCQVQWSKLDKSTLDTEIYKESSRLAQIWAFLGLVTEISTAGRFSVEISASAQLQDLDSGQKVQCMGRDLGRQVGLCTEILASFELICRRDLDLDGDCGRRSWVKVYKKLRTYVRSVYPDLNKGQFKCPSTVTQILVYARAVEISTVRKLLPRSWRFSETRQDWPIPGHSRQFLVQKYAKYFCPVGASIVKQPTRESRPRDEDTAWACLLPPSLHTLLPPPLHFVFESSVSTPRVRARPALDIFQEPSKPHCQAHSKNASDHTSTTSNSQPPGRKHSAYHLELAVYISVLPTQLFHFKLPDTCKDNSSADRQEGLCRVDSTRLSDAVEPKRYARTHDDVTGAGNYDEGRWDMGLKANAYTYVLLSVVKSRMFDFMPYDAVHVECDVRESDEHNQWMGGGLTVHERATLMRRLPAEEEAIERISTWLGLESFIVMYLHPMPYILTCLARHSNGNQKLSRFLKLLEFIRGSMTCQTEPALCSVVSFERPMHRDILLIALYRVVFNYDEHISLCQSGAMASLVHIHDVRSGKREQKFCVSKSGKWVQAFAGPDPISFPKVAEVAGVSMIFAAQTRMTEGLETIVVLKRSGLHCGGCAELCCPSDLCFWRQHSDPRTSRSHGVGINAKAVRWGQCYSHLVIQLVALA
ncbi:hypothetical protein C8F01DRAFT_1331337 [Mycena amicta]|nr:hypothetical protein C8F01DRAFT_1331337 [Mycena amicta]